MTVLRRVRWRAVAFWVALCYGLWMFPACAPTLAAAHQHTGRFYVPVIHRACGKVAYYAAHTGGVMGSCLHHVDGSAIELDEVWQCEYCGHLIADPTQELYFGGHEAE